MNLVHLFILSIILLSAQSEVVLNQISSITSSNNLHYTGTIGVGAEKLFFSFYGNDGVTNPDGLSAKPLVVVVGAPGRSAQYANVAGVGPKILGNDFKLVDNPNSITKFGNVLFLDLLGSGFSFASSPSAIPTTSAAYGVQLTKALNSFNTEASIGKSKKIYLIGESTFLRAIPSLDDIDPLQTIIHISGWFDFYGIGRYYGTGGSELKVITDSDRITIEATFSTCYNYQRSSKFADAHTCYENTLNYLESKSKNRNLYNIQKGSSLTAHLPLVQYYFSQAPIVAAYKAPNTALFESQSSQVQANLFEDLAKNVDSSFSSFFKDYLSVKHVFLTGDDDLITFRKATRYWLENSVNFVDIAKFKAQNLTEYKVDGNVVGYSKSIPQISYYELLNSGHFIYNDQPAVLANIVAGVIGGNANLRVRPFWGRGGRSQWMEVQ